MFAYTYMEKGVFQLQEKSKPMLKEEARCHRKSNPCQYLRQRFAHKIRQCSKSSPRHYGGT